VSSSLQGQERPLGSLCRGVNHPQGATDLDARLPIL